MRKWMHWENAIQEEGDSGRISIPTCVSEIQNSFFFYFSNSIRLLTDAMHQSTAAPKMISRVQKIKFIQDWCKGHQKVAMVIIWMVCASTDHPIYVTPTSLCTLLVLNNGWTSRGDILLFWLSAFILQAVLRITNKG